MELVCNAVAQECYVLPVDFIREEVCEKQHASDDRFACSVCEGTQRDMTLSVV